MTGDLCLSIRQPWAWLIVHGHKDIENRTRPTRQRARILVHAGQQWDIPPEQWAETWPGIDLPATEDMPRGGIVGAVDIVDCVTASDSDWFCGPYGYVLANPEPLPFRAARGQLGFFRVR